MCAGNGGASSIIPIISTVAGIATGQPELIAGGLLSGAGSYIQQQQNNASTEAQYAAKNAAEEQGVAQQEALQGRANTAFNNTLNQVTPTSNTLPNQAASNTAQIQANSTPATGTLLPSNNISNAPQVVQNSFAGKMANAATYGNQQAGALGEVMAPGQEFQQGGEAISAGGANIGQIDNEAQTQATATNAEENAAYNNARKAPSIFGNILGAVGQGLSIAGSVPGASAGNAIGAAQGAVNGSQALTGAPWLASGNYYGAGV